MEIGVFEPKITHHRLRYTNLERIASSVEARANFQAGRCPSASDELDDRFMTGQWTTTPVERDLRKEPMLDLVPLAGAGRQVRHMDLQAAVVRELLQLGLPKPIAGTVAAASIRDDVQL